MKEIHKLHCHKTMYQGKRSVSKIKYICLHYTSNKTDTAKNNAVYFSYEQPRKASAHYIVDGSEIWQSVEDDEIASAVGGSRWSDYKKTGGAKLYKTVTNTNSISIEMCSQKGVITDKTIENAVELVRHLMEKYNIPLSHVVRHFDVTGKPCPGWDGWLGDDAPKWKAFLQKVKGNVEYVYTADIITELTRRNIITNPTLWAEKGQDNSPSYWLMRKAANMTENQQRAVYLETVNDIVWELWYRGIMTDSYLWVDLLNKDMNLYWLSYKICNMTKNR